MKIVKLSVEEAETERVGLWGDPRKQKTQPRSVDIFHHISKAFVAASDRRLLLSFLILLLLFAGQNAGAATNNSSCAVKTNVTITL